MGEQTGAVPAEQVLNVRELERRMDITRFTCPTCGKKLSEHTAARNEWMERGRHEQAPIITWGGTSERGWCFPASWSPVSGMMMG